MVISRNVDVGQTVAASLQAPTLFTIAEDLRKMQVDTRRSSEADVGRLEPGMPATFTVDAYPERAIQGRHPADPRRAPDPAERRHLRRGHRRRQPRPQAEAGHDRERHVRLRRAQGRAARAQRGAALPPARGAGRAARPATSAAKTRSTSSKAVAAARPPDASRGAGSGDAARRRPVGMQRSVWALRRRRLWPMPVEVGVADGSERRGPAASSPRATCSSPTRIDEARARRQARARALF